MCVEGYRAGRLGIIRFRGFQVFGAAAWDARAIAHIKVQDFGSEHEVQAEFTKSTSPSTLTVKKSRVLSNYCSYKI